MDRTIELKFRAPKIDSVFDRSPRWFSWQPRNLLTLGREFESRCRHTNCGFSPQKNTSYNINK